MPFSDQTRQSSFQSKWLRGRRQAFIASIGACSTCGATESLRITSLDPANPFAKGVWGWKAERRLEELKKATALCEVCYAIRQSQPTNHGTWHAYKGKKCRCEVCRKWHAAKRIQQPSRMGKKRRALL
jgi:hypothetical protein